MRQRHPEDRINKKRLEPVSREFKQTRRRRQQERHMKM